MSPMSSPPSRSKQQSVKSRPAAAKPPRSPSALSPRSPAKPVVRSVVLRRLAALYLELRARDARSLYPWRVFALVVAVLVLVYCVHLSLSLFLVPHGLSTRERYDLMFHNDSDFAYLPESRVFITSTAKAGSTTAWTWLHQGITGLPSFDQCNDTYVQNFSSPCWHSKVISPHYLTYEQRWRILHNKDVLRVAITRNPFERLVSAWKSKAACDSDDFGTDVRDRDRIVPILLAQADVQRQSTCLSLASFAQVLDIVRQKYLQGEFDMRNLNKHFRPQECFFEHIPYDIVLDVADLSNVTLLEPILRRLPYRDNMSATPGKLHASKPSIQVIPEATASLLFKFAVLTEPFPYEAMKILQ